MPEFRFRLERGDNSSRELVFDLPDATVVGLVAKQAARHLARDEIVNGKLNLAQELAVLDCDDLVVARYSLGSFVSAA